MIIHDEEYGYFQSISSIFNATRQQYYRMNNLMNFSINLNVDYSQSETTDSNFDKDATPQQIYPGIRWTTK